MYEMMSGFFGIFWKGEIIRRFEGVVGTGVVILKELMKKSWLVRSSDWVAIGKRN